MTYALGGIDSELKTRADASAEKSKILSIQKRITIPSRQHIFGVQRIIIRNPRM